MGKAQQLRAGQPIHPSMYGKRRTPFGMEKMDVDPGTNDMLQRVALEIFNDTCNAGWSFQDALANIYFSGLVHGVDILKQAHPAGEQTEEKK